MFETAVLVEHFGGEGSRPNFKTDQTKTRIDIFTFLIFGKIRLKQDSIERVAVAKRNQITLHLCSVMGHALPYTSSLFDYLYITL